MNLKRLGQAVRRVPSSLNQLQMLGCPILRALCEWWECNPLVPPCHRVSTLLTPHQQVHLIALQLLLFAPDKPEIPGRWRCGRLNISRSLQRLRRRSMVCRNVAHYLIDIGLPQRPFGQRCNHLFPDPLSAKLRHHRSTNLQRPLLRRPTRRSRHTNQDWLFSRTGVNQVAVAPRICLIRRRRNELRRPTLGNLSWKHLRQLSRASSLGFEVSPCAWV